MTLIGVEALLPTRDKIRREGEGMGAGGRKT